MDVKDIYPLPLPKLSSVHSVDSFGRRKPVLARNDSFHVHVFVHVESLIKAFNLSEIIVHCLCFNRTHVGDSHLPSRLLMNIITSMCAYGINSLMKQGISLLDM